MHQCAGTIRCARETTDEDRRGPVLQRFELKEAALWHEDTKYISQANDASVEDMITLVRRSRLRFKPRELQNWSQPSESATKQLSLPACACTSSLSHTAEVEFTASTAQLCLMTQDEIREGEVAGSTRETRDRLRIVARERKQDVGENYSKKI